MYEKLFNLLVEAAFPEDKVDYYTHRHAHKKLRKLNRSSLDPKTKKRVTGWMSFAKRKRQETKDKLSEGQSTGGDSSLTGIRLGRAEVFDKLKTRPKLNKDINKVAAKITKRAVKHLKQPQKSQTGKFEYDRFMTAYFNEPTHKTSLWK